MALAVLALDDITSIIEGVSDSDCVVTTVPAILRSLILRCIVAALAPAPLHLLLVRHYFTPKLESRLPITSSELYTGSHSREAKQRRFEILFPCVMQLDRKEFFGIRVIWKYVPNY
ncbi:hypothetical protein SLA2020_384640 [Shorea laevis]